jgi:hypothetical protein
MKEFGILTLISIAGIMLFLLTEPEMDDSGNLIRDSFLNKLKNKIKEWIKKI